MSKKALTTNDVCTKYSVSRDTLKRMRERGEIKFGKAGIEYRFDSDECDRVFCGITKGDGGEGCTAAA